MKKTAAIILAAGRGTRMGTDKPKQFIEIGGYPLVYYSLKAFSDSFVDDIVLVCGEEDREYCTTEIVEKYGFSKVKSIVSGGRERYHSVFKGLTALRCIAEGDCSDPCEIVFIHDGARPFVTEDIIKRSYDAAEAGYANVVAVPAKDTVKVSDDDGFVDRTLRRDHIWLMQTPQTFDFYEIYEAYGKLIGSEAELLERGVMITDDAMVLEYFTDHRIKLVMGDYRNIKITTPEDLSLAEKELLC
ncbi:MAG: 2-C-methyl-D-erythritol 4-phosphate cytidylyltransferase [Lachnospiraceae bacterium]|nr:2-C-methyl-D-erythritol 4-phosphate cytidylyltransferase [Lachnospiraceae bacterium]